MSRSVVTVLPSFQRNKQRKLKPRERKFQKQLKKAQKAKEKGKHYAWGLLPLGPSNSIKFHLVHRSSEDPLLDIPNETFGEWVLEPEVRNKRDFDRVQKFCSQFDIEEVLPHHYRTDEFIELTSAKSMPILPSQLTSRHKRNGNGSVSGFGLGAIMENGNPFDSYDYSQHYKAIDDERFMDYSNDKNGKKSEHKKNRKKGDIEILEQYIFEEDYEIDDDAENEKNKKNKMNKDNDHNKGDGDDLDELPDHLKAFGPDAPETDADLQRDPQFKDYIDLLLSDHSENAEESDNSDDDDFEVKEHKYSEPLRETVGDVQISGDLQDDFLFHALGVDESEFKRTQIGSFEPYGARFAKWSESEKHRDKFKDSTGSGGDSQSLYDRTIRHLMNIQNAKERGTGYLTDITEERGPFSDAETGQFDDAESGSESDNELDYDPDLPMLDTQFEVMLHQNYNDDLIGELDDDDLNASDLHGDLRMSSAEHFNKETKKDSLRYKWNVYLKRKHRRVRRSLGRANRYVTLRMLGVDPNAPKESEPEQKAMTNTDIKRGNEEIQENVIPQNVIHQNVIHQNAIQQNGDSKMEEKEDDDESDEIIYFSDSDSDKDGKSDGNSDDNSNAKSNGISHGISNGKKDEVVDWRELDSDDERRIDKEIEEHFKKPPPPKWDVESILSTRTNHENHPRELKVNVEYGKKTRSGTRSGFKEPKSVQNGDAVNGILESIVEDESDSEESDDIEFMESKESMNGQSGSGMEFSFGTIGGDTNGLVTRTVGNTKVIEFKGFEERTEEKDNDMNEELDDDEKELVGGGGMLSGSRKGETKEKKRERKRLLKEMRKNRRQERKANRQAFKKAKKMNVKMDVTQQQSHGDALRL